MKTRVQLLEEIEQAKNELTAKKAALVKFDSEAENNVFATINEAEGIIEDMLREQATDDCEGRHNCGSPAYSASFIVGDVTYVGTLKVEYNRHDKTFYFVESAKFSYAAK